MLLSRRLGEMQRITERKGCAFSLQPRRLHSFLAHNDDVERCDRALEALERHLAGGLHLDVVFDFRVETLRNQDLAGSRLVRKP
jgi:hypothetical protein